MNRSFVKMRFVRFNLVGALGMAVQLGLVALLTRVMSPTAATLCAVAAAVTHNFVWHWLWTWSDVQHGDRTMAGHFVRFALANGVVSLAGNAAVMWLLADRGTLPPIPANLIAIAVCGLLNFRASDRIVFRSGPLVGQARIECERVFSWLIPYRPCRTTSARSNRTSMRRRCRFITASITRRT
jgi:putative flippase GtrA